MHSLASVGPLGGGTRATWEGRALRLQERALLRQECPQHSLPVGCFRLQGPPTRDPASDVLRQPGPWPLRWFFASNFLAGPVLERTMDPSVARRVFFLNLKPFLCSVLPGYVSGYLRLSLKILPWDLHFYLNIHIHNSTIRTISQEEMLRGHRKT